MGNIHVWRSIGDLIFHALNAGSLFHAFCSTLTLSDAMLKFSRSKCHNFAISFLFLCGSHVAVPPAIIAKTTGKTSTFPLFPVVLCIT